MFQLTSISFLFHVQRLTNNSSQKITQLKKTNILHSFKLHYYKYRKCGISIEDIAKIIQENNKNLVKLPNNLNTVTGSYRIPNLQFDLLSINCNHPSTKFYSYSKQR